MALTAKQIKQLNKMNRSASNVNLGSVINTLQSQSTNSGSWYVSVAEASASAVVIQTAVPSIAGFIVQTYRSGSPILGSKVVVTGGSNITITSGSPSYVVSGSDVINYIVF